MERIVDEAIELMDAEGLHALTVRSLSARLGTSSATLYRHVASVDELLVLVIDRVLGEVALLSDEAPARERVVALAHEFRRVLREHPGVVPALRAAPLLGPNAMRGAAHGLTSLLDLGFPTQVALSGYLALIDYVLGTVFFDTAGVAEHSRDRVADEDIHAVLDQVVDGPGVFDAPSRDAVFGIGVEAMLDGLSRAEEHPTE